MILIDGTPAALVAAQMMKLKLAKPPSKIMIGGTPAAAIAALMVGCGLASHKCSPVAPTVDPEQRRAIRRQRTRDGMQRLRAKRRADAAAARLACVSQPQPVACGVAA